MVAPTPKTDDGLVDVRVATKTTTYLRELWERRSYTWYVAESEVRKRQISTFFGSFWHLLNPALSILVYFVIFGLILETDRGVENSFLLFLTVGLFVFQFTQRAVTQGSLSIIANRGLVQAIRFPRTLLPLSATLTEAIAAAPSFVVIYVVALIEGQSPRWSWPLFPLIAVWQVAFNLGLAMIAARITTRFRDMVQLLPFMFRLLMYGSGVLFAVESYVSGPALVAIQVLNPIFGFISLSRWAVIGTEVATSTLIALVIWTLVSLLGGFAFFKAAEHRYDHV